MQNLAPYPEIYFDPLCTHEDFYCIWMAEVLLLKALGTNEVIRNHAFIEGM